MATVKQVITAFVCDGRRILLALRSDDVSTYPRHWAGISGYLEREQPLERAFLELAEESGLARASLILLRSGNPLDIEDAARGLRFRVHPFLFYTDTPDQVRSDWEAARLEWVPLEEVLLRRRQPTVPQLYEAFQNVWPPWPIEQALHANLEAAVAWLQTDRTMGAGQLARSAAGELIKLVRVAQGDLPPGAQAAPCEAHAGAGTPAVRGAREAGPDGSIAQRPMRDILDRLASARPAMAPLVNMMAAIGGLLQKTPERSGAVHLIRGIQEMIAHSAWAERETARRASERFAPGERLMTISYSGTVAAALRAAAGKLAGLVVCEGRPLLEGRRLAAELAAAGLPVTLITEAQAFLFMRHTDRLVLGADAVLPDGSIRNKAGSALLALAATELGKPVTVVADSWKRVPPGSPAETACEENSPAEVWDAAPHNVSLANLYFEVIPRRWIAELIDENRIETMSVDRPSQLVPDKRCSVQE
jgi:translation initiation factor 2B subunit (eIF-2B alpha/beta/delta family)